MVVEQPRQDAFLSKLVNHERYARNIRRAAAGLFAAVAFPGGWALTVPFAIGDGIFIAGMNVYERSLRWSQKHEANILEKRGASTLLVEAVRRRDVGHLRLFHNGMPDQLVEQAKNARREFQRVSYP